MLIDTLKTIFKRDLNKLKTEIDLYHDETIIWHTEKKIANSAGNLSLHLIGNLNNYIGLVLGKTPYVRNREFEFMAKNIPRHELTGKIQDTLIMVENTLDKLHEGDLKNDYPIMVFEEKMTTGYFLVHLTTHLNYHLGQINYHRRLLDKE